jgi:hypothetical protein
MAAFGHCLVHADRPTEPGMPPIPNFSRLGTMGVALSTYTWERAHISHLPRTRRSRARSCRRRQGVSSRLRKSAGSTTATTAGGVTGRRCPACPTFAALHCPRSRRGGLAGTGRAPLTCGPLSGGIVCVRIDFSVSTPVGSPTIERRYRLRPVGLLDIHKSASERSRPTSERPYIVMRKTSQRHRMPPRPFVFGPDAQPSTDGGSLRNRPLSNGAASGGAGMRARSRTNCS